MASKMSSSDEQPISDINVTPFVDIILVVLIIFMVTTPIIMNPSVHVNLPKASSGDQTIPSQLNISIDKNGTCFFNGKEVSNEELNKLSKEQVDKNPDIQAIISADTTVQHGRVIEVLDAVKSAGVVKFAISISKK
jgi:biopolymer transport protein ExbD